MIAARGTAVHVEKLVRGFRRAKEAAELSRDKAQQANRCLRYHYDEDGSLVLKARLPAEVGALVLKAVDAAIAEMPLPDVPAGTSEGTPSYAARRADALGLLAESFMEHDAAAQNGGDRHLVTVHFLHRRQCRWCHLLARSNGHQRKERGLGFFPVLGGSLSPAHSSRRRKTPLCKGR